MADSTVPGNNRIWLVFAVVFVWKVVLLVTAHQPVPANDAFFYDGAVVNYLQHGGYFNPSLALALPISGTKVFCAYPPLYQMVLLGWMSVFGVSAMAAMTLHVTLFGVYLLILLAIFRRLNTPAWCVNMAGTFLLLITFHDRPDSLAHVLGMASIYAWIRSRETGTEPRHIWLMVALNFLTLCASLQLWAIYFACLWIGTVAAALPGRERFPFKPMVVMTVAPPLAVIIFKFSCPQLWAGFLEHARQTPSLTGLRIPQAGEFLKIARTAPGIILIAILLPLTWMKQRRDFDSPVGLRHEIVLVPVLLSALAVVVAALLFWTPNAVQMANYLQPLVVGTYLALCGTLFAGQRWLRTQAFWLALAVAIGSVRAVGMTTWGVACAVDVGYSAAIRSVGETLDHCPLNSTAVVSSAFLYEASLHPLVRSIHSDWMTPANAKAHDADLDGLIALRPARLILTQFDYFRRYRRVLDEVAGNPALASPPAITNTAKTPAPDSFPALKKVVQHISWAPVIVELSWRENGK